MPVRPEDFGAVKVARPEDFGAVPVGQSMADASGNFEAAGQTVQDLLMGKYGKEILMGGLRGASRIGTTLLRPIDAALGNQSRTPAIEEFFQQNANPKSLQFKMGDLGAQIAGTAAVGGVLAKGVSAAGQAIPALANVAPKIATALETGGLSLGQQGGNAIGNMATRIGAGAVTGGAMTGLVNPEQAKTGAIIGGALPPAVKLAGLAGSGLRSVADYLVGAMTGTSMETVKNAFNAGKIGSAEFLSNMRGVTPFDDIVDKAKQGLQNMRADRAAAYRSGMFNVKNDKTVLDMTPINDAVNAIKQSGNFKGKVINQKAGGVIDEIDNIVSDWAKSNPNEFHTPEGLDALKQAIGDIRDSTQFGTPARHAADSIYNAVKGEIQKQAPTYANVMKDYAEASNTIKEIEKSLSAGEKSSKDTAIRKLQSLMRNNAQTNYGNRLELANTLEQRGGVNLAPAVAGQAMNSWLPRGMVGSLEKFGMVGAPFVAPAALLAAPFTSPRIMGELFYGLGNLSGAVGRQGLLMNPVTRAGLLNAANP